MPRMPDRPTAAVPLRRPSARAAASPDPVDTADGPSLSFAPLDRPIGHGKEAGPAAGQPARSRASDARPRGRRPRLIVEGDRAATVTASLASTGGSLGAMTEFPVQISKVQAPPLRDETLARDRLLDWLSVKIHRRVVLLTAEAGYGKTTLLADFTRRTRLRVLWFRLDRGDRDWTSFIAHLVAAIRIHVPDFGGSTRSLLAETATTAPPLETVLDAFLREFLALPVEPTALVFDDFHLVEESADVRHVVRELLTRGPERLCFVFASRREPPIRLARLRALGEVAELRTDDLRFDEAETEKLFRETYEMRLEPSVLAELSRRTEGWAASLQLIRAALHERNPGEVRSFISSLSGAEGHLYEYLAEEVIGELPEDLQQFLMRTSVLETVDLALGPVAADISVEEAARLIEEGERHGLLGRGGRARHVVRAHPLVRDFLQARLVRAIGGRRMQAIHRRIGETAMTRDWQLAVRHFIDANAEPLARSVMVGAIERVLATGAYTAAQELVTELAGGELPGAPGLVLRSRVALQRADRSEGLTLAESAWRTEPTSTAAILNLVSARTLAGDVAGALEANALLETAGESLAGLGRAFENVMSTSLRGPLDTTERDLGSLAASCRQSGQQHFLGVALLNLSLIRMAMGNAPGAIESSTEAVEALSATSAGVELVAARLARAQALAFAGHLDAARSEADAAAAIAPAGQALELALETAQLEALLGQADRVQEAIQAATRGLGPDTDQAEQALLSRALVNIGCGDLSAAADDIRLLRFGAPTTAIAFEARRHLLVGLVGMLSGDPAAQADLRVGTDLARDQSAWLWAEYGRVLLALSESRGDTSSVVLRAASERPVVLSMVAEAVVERIDSLNEEALSALLKVATGRPERWRASIRRKIQSGSVEERVLACHILEHIGDRKDVKVLRDASKRIRGQRGARFGYALARRLAEPVFVKDLGRVQIERGKLATDGREIRRKVLALLCLLLTRPRLALTRDEVVDSLWPEHDPASAMNSLNQTVYFLRRVFEPDFEDDLSPGYVGQNGETVWLDEHLVDSASRRCLDIIRSMPGEPTAEGAVALAASYPGKFALDFAYEEWADEYRDSLHAAYLRVMEQAIRLDMNSGHIDRGVFLAERAVDVDPEAEEIQLALARLYRQAGAHAAAAERYGTYAKAMSDLGIEPQAL